MAQAMVREAGTDRTGPDQRREEHRPDGEVALRPRVHSKAVVLGRRKDRDSAGLESILRC